MPNEKDPTLNRCGLPGLNTPPWDPFRKEACDPHDDHMTEGRGAWVTFRDFATSSTLVMLKGLYAVTLYPVYFVVGGVFGAIWQMVKRK